MFIPSYVVDSFQSSKRAMTRHLIKDKIILNVCEKFIDAQTDFAQVIIKNNLEVSKYAIDCYLNTWFPNPKRDKDVQNNF